MPTRRTWWNLTLIILLIVLATSTFMLYRQNASLRENPQEIAQEEAETLAAKVSLIYALPEDETPTIATVMDPEKLKEQSFFAKAKVGDKVLLYTKAQKAILYSPKENRVLEIAPLNLGEGSATGAASSTTSVE